MEEKKEQLRLTKSRWKLLRERIGKNIINTFQKINLRNEAVERKLQMSEEEQIEELKRRLVERNREYESLRRRERRLHNDVFERDERMKQLQLTIKKT